MSKKSKYALLFLFISSIWDVSCMDHRDEHSFFPRHLKQENFFPRHLKRELHSIVQSDFKDSFEEEGLTDVIVATMRRDTSHVPYGQTILIDTVNRRDPLEKYLRQELPELIEQLRENTLGMYEEDGMYDLEIAGAVGSHYIRRRDFTVHFKSPELTGDVPMLAVDLLGIDPYWIAYQR